MSYGRLKEIAKNNNKKKIYSHSQVSLFFRLVLAYMKEIPIGRN